MTKIKLTLAFIAMLFGANLFAQSSDTTPAKAKIQNYYEISVGAKTGEFMDALSANHLWSLGKNKKFKAGLGLRLTNYFGTNQAYITAPAILTSGRTDPGVLFSETIEANLDTLTFSKAQSNSINLSIHLQYTIFKKFDLGFNIDAIGFSFGGSKNGIFKSSIAPAGTAISQKAKPTSFNYLLVSDNDKGTLNSELFLRFWIKENMGIKIGLGFLFTEYTTVNKLTFNNSRFRNKSAMPVVGYCFTL